MTAPTFATFDGSVALVTGGASGIGAATAAQLGAEGAAVVVADVQIDAGKRVADEVGGRFIELDVTDAVAWGTAIESILTTEVASTSRT